MEHPIQSETEVAEVQEIKRLRLTRRIQAVTIELCMAYMSDQNGFDVEDQEAMKRHVSRVCGLTEKDFEGKYGTSQDQENTQNQGGNPSRKVDINDGINAIVGGGKYQRAGVKRKRSK